MRLNSGREVPVIAANRMIKQYLYRYQVCFVYYLQLRKVNQYRQLCFIAMILYMWELMQCIVQGHIDGFLVLGGVDKTGSHIYRITSKGSTDKLPYATMGSGSLASMSVFESDWKPNMTVSNKQVGYRFSRIERVDAQAYIL